MIDAVYIVVGTPILLFKIVWLYFSSPVVLWCVVLCCEIVFLDQAASSRSNDKYKDVCLVVLSLCLLLSGDFLYDSFKCVVFFV